MKQEDIPSKRQKLSNNAFEPLDREYRSRTAVPNGYIPLKRFILGLVRGEITGLMPFKKRLSKKKKKRERKRERES